MKNFNKLFSKISTQIAITVAFLCILLFMILNVIVFDQSRASFKSVIDEIRIQQNENSNQGFIVTRDYNTGFIRFIPTQQSQQFNVNSDGSIPSNPLLERFNEVFQSSLFSVAVIALILSVVIGILVAKLFSDPLNQLSSGMKKLRDNNYKINLAKTGTDEFDHVINEFNTLTQELQKVEDLRKDLISDTSHELKTPITSLMGQLQGIKDGVLELNDERIDSLASQVNRLDDLVERLQEFSRLRNKGREIEKTTIKFQKLIEDSVSEFETDLKKKDIKIDIDISNDLEINGNYEMLQRVFENLTTNALKYSKAKNIYINADKNEIKFSDDGIGVDSEHLPYLFERFYRVEKSRNRKTGGLGLGLAIVKEIVEVHGWEIKVQNRKERGLEFVISISNSTY